MSRLTQTLRSPLGLGIGAGVCVLIAVVVLVVALSGSSGGGAPSAGLGARTAPLESIFEADVQLEADPVGTLALMRRLGVTRMRVFVPWGLISGRPSIAPEPTSATRPAFDATNPSAYPSSGWVPYDAIVRAAKRAGIGLDFNLGPPAPEWALGPGDPASGIRGNWEPNATDFGQFVHAIATRYSGRFPDPLHPGQDLPRVDFWAVWNEPNFGVDLAPQAVDHTKLEVSPRYYRALVDAAWSALHATGHGGDTILVGELSPKGQTVANHPGNFDGMVPLRFLRALYCVNSSYQILTGAAASTRGCPGTKSGFVQAHPGLFESTGFSDHPYPQTLPPNEPTPDEPEFTDLPSIPRLEAALDRLQQIYGQSKRFPIWSTEYGYLTTPPEALFHAVSPATAARYLNWAEYLSWRNPRMRSYDQYLLSDPPGGNFPNGIEFANGSPKPGYRAFRFPLFMPVTSARAGASLEVWGCARPSRYARLDTGRVQQVQIQFRASGQTKFRVLQTVTLADPYGYFDVHQRFDSRGTVRLEWSYPNGERIYSRLVQVTLS